MTKETQTKYTVFAECEGLNGSTYETFENNLDNTYHDGSIEGVINFLVEEGYTPVAWASELTHGYAGRKTVDGLRAESLAAGRTIELVDGKYVARGVAEEKTTFKIGSVYREQGGGIIRLVAYESFSEVHGRPAADAVAITSTEGGGRFLDDGRYCHERPGDEGMRLLPGELVLRDGSWVVAEEEPAKVEPVAPSNTPLFDHLRRLRESGQGPAAVEKARPALDWNKSKPFNNFPGYSVKCDTGPQIEADKHPLSLSPDMADSSHQANPAFGSAALLKE
jgi:hypothetical protein